jgi:hypothetical protein
MPPPLEDFFDEHSKNARGIFEDLSMNFHKGPPGKGENI